MNLLHTAIEQNWTIGEFNKRIQEQSLLDNPSLDRQLDRGELNESAGRRNILNKPRGLHTQSPFIDADSLNLNSKKGGKVKWQS